MTDRDSDADRLQDRLSKRFDSDETTESTKQDKQTKDTKQTKGAKDSGGGSNDETDGDETTADSQTIDYRDEWETRLLYLPEDVSELVEYQYKRLDLETDWSVKKERHFYPVVVTHGVQRLAEMDAEEFTAAVENLGIGPT
jgi:hypothetical protein